MKLFILFRCKDLSEVRCFFCNGIKIGLETIQDILYTRNSRFSCESFQRGFRSDLIVDLRKETVHRSGVRGNVLTIHFKRSNVRGHRRCLRGRPCRSGIHSRLDTRNFSIKLRQPRVIRLHIRIDCTNGVSISRDFRKIGSIILNQPKLTPN